MIDVNAIDWNEAWKKPFSPEDSGKGCTSCGKRWSDPEKCRRYNDMVKEDNWSAASYRMQSMDIKPDFRVLDIGAGPGTLSIPLAGVVKDVTSVEPSGGMLTCLRENTVESGISNITIVPKKWEDIVVEQDLTPPYDLVISSYSLAFPDLQEALQKMNDVSRKYVYIFWFADMMSPWQRNYLEIWEQLFGIPPETGRKPNIIYNLLNQMGIYANVEVNLEEISHRFSSVEEALEDQSTGLNLSTQEQRSLLKKYLEKKLIQEKNYCVIREKSPRCKIWWDKEQFLHL
ncbi:MAG: class I SAM-dependent methyltransferase [Methanospirillum sp.]|uniref:class I SAM-dependent methyltransferase n=1 Tax=Methanospirillum sp. TaxID=45200 RepID=UPI002374DF27|nr:class I SAM-dependent methyltransferase [Methanospirillum sp.]MDD1728590.1 class I SAM-dependent methyltransferase [Methanospirillum sp.]